RFDYVIWKADCLGLRLDVALLDFWQWVGGVQQVCRWFLPDYNPSSDARRYSFFYTDPRTKEFYRSWVAHVLDRRNSLTGRKYRDEPAIMAWDLMNEPEIDNTKTDAAGVPLAESWIREMSAYVKSLDAHHLVCSGGEGFYDRDSVIDPATELAIGSIDFGSWHSYPDYHGITPAQLVELIHRHSATAAAAGKPHLLQEFSYSHLHDDQPAAFQSWTDAVYDDSDSAGWLFWRLVGRVKTPPTLAFPAAEESPLDGWAGDNGEHFDIIDDPAAANPNAWQSAQVLTAAAARLVARNVRTKKRTDGS
ncbi:MAG TPA: cellulase family glycosylhydrolase, partial [Actinopolymorphaceae bacterium]|nr:cellulase family glycosylhydrolase [Actinopolymorphaceae bacterium]